MHKIIYLVNKYKLGGNTKCESPCLAYLSNKTSSRETLFSVGSLKKRKQKFGKVNQIWPPAIDGTAMMKKKENSIMLVSFYMSTIADVVYNNWSNN